MAADALVSIDDLREFLGVDSDSDSIIANERDNALDEIRRATGFDWEHAREQLGALNEAVQILVYISYYGVRDGVKNLVFLERRKIQLMKMLQYSAEAQA